MGGGTICSVRLFKLSMAAVGLASLVAQNSGGEAEVAVPVSFFEPGGGWSPLAAGRMGWATLVTH